MRNVQTHDLFSELSRTPGLLAVIGRLAASDRPNLLRLSGLTLTAKALYSALLYQITNRPQLIIVDGNKQAEALTTALRAFFSLLHIESPPLLLPALDVLPGQPMSPHTEILEVRATALVRLATETVPVTVMPVAAALQRLDSPEHYRQLTQRLKIGDEIPIEDLLQHLESIGYEKRDPVETVGQYSLRGGILDVFPPEDTEPVRLEFFGDEIDSIRRFDPVSQRSTHKLGECAFLPLTEFQKSRGLLTRLLAHLRESGVAHRDLPFEGEAFAGWELLATALEPRRHSVLELLKNPLVLIDEPESLRGAADRFWVRVRDAARLSSVEPNAALFEWPEFYERAEPLQRVEVRELSMGMPGRDDIHVSTRPAMVFHGNIQVAIAEARSLVEHGMRVVFFANTTGEIERLSDVFSEYRLSFQVDLGGERAPDYLQQRTKINDAPIALIRGSITRGTVFPDARLAVFGSEDLFDSPDTVAKPGKSHLSTFSADQFDLKAGDYIVHAEHGVGQFLGLREIAAGDTKGDYMLIEYAGGNKLYLPLARMDLIQRFRGEGESKPKLDSMGGQTWVKTKTRIKTKMRDMAEELLKLYAQRKMAEGFAFSPDSNWQREFEDAFEYTETKDQKSAISDIKRDMESEQPMDRLLCGDVGFGKTEVVMRAAFKALGDGKQVAVLAPTTVLCFQHFETFKKRFQSFPVRIEMLSRFRSKHEIAEVLKDLADGKVDIVLGTHRIFSKDVEWKDLGLILIDEEQRFGVKHKERLKEIRQAVDAISMSATPIPRTLHMSLLGLRDMSVIETPPKDRLAIHTVVAPFGPDLIKSGIEMEMARGGQVYFVHNRVDSIYMRAAMIQELMRSTYPNLRVGVGHGQMPEADLEKVMLQFMSHQFDVFVCTTIVENGLDIPLANAMFIENAEHYGLSALYQLRGRVGRSNRRAYCYLLIPQDTELTEIARKRLAALKEFSDLGAGFKIAALDLELRGAGNLLGGEQHGHINAIGFDMYVRMLEDTVRELRGEEVALEIHSNVNLGLDLRIPPTYIADENQRLRAYKRIAQAATGDDREKFALELADRYGPVPEDVKLLLQYSAIKSAAEKLGISAIDRRNNMLNVMFHQETRVDGEKLMALVSATYGASFTPAGILRLPIELTGAQGAVPAATVLALVESKLIKPLI